MSVPLLDLKAQYATLRTDIEAAMRELCEAQSFIMGPAVTSFEKSIASYCGTKHAIGVSSGSDALLVSLMALGIGQGDAVLTTPYSFFATAGAVWRLGATPVFADVEESSLNLDPRAARDLLLRRKRKGAPPCKAMIPVHLFGQCADMTALMDLADEFGMSVVEDAAQAIGAEYLYRGKPARAGAMGAVGCFSFFPSKNLGGFGDGGLVTTDDDAMAARLRMLRNHGAEPKYYHSLVGGNFRLDSLQAAVLSVKLEHLDSWHAARRANAAVYDVAFAGSAVRTPEALWRGDALRNWHIYNQYVVRAPNRDLVLQRLKAAGIGCEVYYPVPLHLQACFASLGHTAGDFPVSEKAAKETLALPVYPELTSTQKDEVVAAVLAACRETA